MYNFAVIALLALATVKLVDFLSDTITPLKVWRSLLVFAGAIGSVWMLDYSLFEGFGIAVRNHATGVWMTGFIVAGTTVAWRAVFGWLTHDRAEGDETLGVHTDRKLRSAA